MATTNQLESNLNDIFGKKAPVMPAGGKKALVEYLPWISVVLGVVTLLSAWSLWQWAHSVSNLINEANTLSHLYGGGNVVSNRLSASIWLSLLVLTLEGVLYVLAYPGLRDRKKIGWNYLYYGALLNVAYGVVVFFTNYGGFSNLIGALIGSALGFWILFQVRSSYSATKPPIAPATTTKI